jgi:glycosyltransferase involved in cell wall biosynthesis
VRILLTPLSARISGTQINCVDLGAKVRDMGHDVLVYVEDGPLSELIAERQLRHVVARHAAYRERGTSAALAIRRVVSRERIDLVHSYERARTAQAYLGAYLLGGVPVVSTVYSLGLPHDLPDDITLIMGTRELVEEACRRHRGPVELIEPPVDTDADHPGVDGGAFRRSIGIGDDELVVGVVTRLSQVLKLEGLRGAIRSVATLAAELPARLVIVGDGPARERVQEAAREANSSLGRPVVVLPGFMMDPRPAYAAADVVLGQGSSALRGMSFGKPTIILGEGGFSDVFEPSTAPTFLEIGMYGFGERVGGYGGLTEQLRRLLADASLRAELGGYGRRMIEDRFSLTAAATVLEGLYRRAAAAPTRPSGRLAPGGRNVLKLTLAHGRRWLRPEPSREGRRPSEW